MIMLVLFIALLVILYFLKGIKSLMVIPFIFYFIEIGIPAIRISGYSNEYSVLIRFIFSFFNLFLFFRIITKHKKHNHFSFSFIYLFWIYLLILCVFSSDIWWSTKRVLTVISSTSLYISALLFIDNLSKYRKLLQSLFYLMILYISNVLISSVLQYGNTYYNNNIIYFGDMILWSSSGFIFSLLTYNTINKVFKRDKVFVFKFLILAGIVLLFLIAKRAFILSILIGFIIQYSYHLNRAQFKRIIGVTLFLIIAISLFGPRLVHQIQERELTTKDYTEEGRILEYLYYPTEVATQENPTLFFLFGKEVFNSQSKFLIFKKIIDDPDRILHTDLSRLLYTTGIVGFILFNLMMLNIYRNFSRKKNLLFNKKSLQLDFRRAFVSMFIVMFVYISMDTILYNNIGGIVFLLIGAVSSMSNLSINETN